MSAAPSETGFPTGHVRMANAVRALAMDAVEQAASGHPGMPMGMADAATVLFTRILKFDAAAPDWPDRDRFVLSAGHGSMLLYALLHLTGYEDVGIDQLRRFRQLGSATAGHPEHGEARGIETTTGPLGQGLANAVGMALAERMLAARHGEDIVDHRTYVLAGDGCLMEGVSHEAVSLAGHLRLNRLIVLFDDNDVSIDGPKSLAESDDQLARFAASGWATERVDGHDPEAVAKALLRAGNSDRPSLIACRTVIGFGAPNKEGTAATHGAPLGGEEVAAARERLDWPHPPFSIPEDILADWRLAGRRGAAERQAWDSRVSALPPERREVFERALAGDAGNGAAALEGVRRGFIEDAPKLATRQSSQKCLDVLSPALPGLVGGSADLTGSNGTLAEGMLPVAAGDYAGSYIHYGVREHAMAAAMNGIALHGGLVPYGGTFLAFADYCRPALRLAALMRQRVIHVMTHDSIGLGEDGPTHQPVEHLAALRAIPNLHVFRPADAVETAECWALALALGDSPSVLALTRQGVGPVRGDRADGERNLCAAGAYVVVPADGDRKATILATGSEVEIAVAARDLLAGEGIDAAVVSMPCLEIFDRQEEAYQRAILGPEDGVRVAVEAAVRQGWDRYIGPRGGFVGMHGFGASAPAGDLYRHFGITAEAVAATVKDRLAAAAGSASRTHPGERP